MDAFFAAVEERANPKLKGLPIVVGADPKEGQGRGVVSTANYKAREYGICSALPISTAWRLSEEAKRQGKPEAVFVSVNFKNYSEVSKNIIKILEKYSGRVLQTSIDEAYFDLSPAENFKKAGEIAKKIKSEIRKREHLTASIGIGPNKLIAKIASDFQKPDGLTVITKERAENFLEPLPVRKIPGIGPKTEEYFKKRGIEKIIDLKKYSREELTEMLGKWGAELYEKTRGRGSTDLAEVRERKSIGEQTTFETDSLNFETVWESLQELSTGVFRRFQKKGFKSFQAVTVTIRFSDFETHTRSQTLRKPANSLKAIEMKSLKLLMSFFDRRENPRRKLIRLVGVRIEKLG